MRMKNRRLRKSAQKKLRSVLKDKKTKLSIQKLLLVKNLILRLLLQRQLKVVKLKPSPMAQSST
jgi:hypothetical protein